MADDREPDREPEGEDDGGAEVSDSTDSWIKIEIVMVWKTVAK